MLGLIIAAIAILGLYLRSLTPPQRLDFLRRVLELIRRARRKVTDVPPGCEAFFEMLRQRTRRVFVTPAIIGLNAVLFVVIFIGTGDATEPGALIEWGGSFGPRTTNGEWWRLVTGMFVHSSALHVLANAAGLLWMGFVLERLVGPVAFAATYLAAGVLSGLADLAAHEVAVTVGSSGAVYGIYGLFTATMIWGVRLWMARAIPLAVLKMLASGAALFLLYDLMAQGLQSDTRLVGFLVGFGCGLLLAAHVTERKPLTRRIATVSMAALAMALGWAVPLRGLADVRAELADVAALEARTTGHYDAGIDRFRSGRGTTKDLIERINRIRPQLQAQRAELESIGKVPREQQAAVGAALEYLTRRDESWRLRADALRKGNLRMLRQADAVERKALDLLRQISPPSR